MAQIGRQLVRNLIRNGTNIRRHMSVLSNTVLNEHLRLNPSSRGHEQIRKIGAYDSDGKTTVTLLNKDQDYGLMINAYSQLGFRLNNNAFVVGPMAIFSRTVLSWNVETIEDINEESLRLIGLLEPKIDILIIGLGDLEVTPAFSKRILQYMKEYRINVEVLKTAAACSTFNFLNAEHRMVAALLIPPVHMRVTEDDLMRRSNMSGSFRIDDMLDDTTKDITK